MIRLPDPRERPWVTPYELAELTGESLGAIYRALDHGDLPEIKLGARLRRIPTAGLYERLGLPLPAMEAIDHG